MGCFWPTYIMFKRKKYRGVVWWHWILIQNLKENWLVLSKWHGEFGKFSFKGWKIVGFFWKIKWHQNKNWKQPDSPDAFWKLYFTLEINGIAHTANYYFFYTCSTESMFLRYEKISKKVVKLASFLTCLVHTFLEHDGYFLKN